MVPPVKPKAKPGKAQFSIDMDAKGIIALLVMASLSLAVAFYLGMVFGKAQRVPGLEPEPAAEAPAQAEAAGAAPAAEPKDLQIYKIKEDPSGLEDLKTDFQRMKEETDEVAQDEAQRETQTQALEKAQDQGGLALEDDAPKPKPEGAAKAEATAKQPHDSWADKVLSDSPATPAGPLFAIQVMATRSKPKADGLVTQLKRKGFEAYVDEVKVEGTSMYRLRVGKDDKDKIAKMKDRLEKSVKGLDSDLKIVRIN